MYGSSPEEWKAMLLRLCKENKGQMHSVYLDFKIVKLYHPRYSEKIELTLPMFVIEFK